MPKDVIVKNVESIVENNMSEYSAAVLLDRAIPDLRDGFKPSYRRVLYGMYLQKCTNFTKSANVAGFVMKLHPHGSTYGVMVGMVQKDNQTVPLLEGKGNFSQYTSRDLQAAADRYSEVRLAPVSIDMMRNFEKNVVKFIDNYDGTLKMPEVLPVTYPAILTIAQSGIGVGFASSTPSFNLIEVCDAVKLYLESEKHSLLIPDFATGGYIVNDEEIFKKINETGSGSVRLRGKAVIEGNEIHITEIPYSTTREAIIEKVVELTKSGKFKEVIDVQDLTGLSGMMITVTARRNSDMKLLLEKLYRFTPLQSSYSSNMNVLVNDLPRVLGTQQIIEQWVEWRRGCVERGLLHDIGKMREKLHLLRGLEKVLVDIDEAIEIIRRSKEALIEKTLMSHFGIDEIQAIDISNMKLRNINKDYIVRKIKDIGKFEKEIKALEKIVGNKSKLNEIIIKDMETIKEKYGVKRRTELIEISDRPIEIPREVVPNYQVNVFLTQEGYAYKTRSNEYEPKLKPGDKVLKTFSTDNEAEIVIFGKDTFCYKIEVSRIEETRAGNLGVYLPTLVRNLELQVASYTVFDKENKFIVMVYSNNRVVKVSMKVFDSNRRILKGAYNEKQGGLVDILTFKDNVNLRLITTRTKVEFNTEILPMAASRLSTGTYQTRKGTAEKVEIF